MRAILIFFIIIPLVFEFSLKNLASSALDFVPIVGNVKGLYEAISGKDMISGEELSDSDRALSLVGAIPFGNYLKNAKHLKNGQKFVKAAQRAQKAGKVKNALSFWKAGARAMKKANFVQNTVKFFSKVTKGILRQTEEKTDNQENDEM